MSEKKMDAATVAELQRNTDRAEIARRVFERGHRGAITGADFDDAIKRPGPTDEDREVLAEIWKADPQAYQKILDASGGDIAEAAASIRAVRGIPMNHPDAWRKNEGGK